MTTADVLFFLGYGAFFGGLAGWWARGRRERRRWKPVVDRAMLLRDLYDDSEEQRRARLAYDTLYDEKHPEEWA